MIRLIYLLVPIALSANLGLAQEQQKSFYLPKNPRAAAYLLGRLSNKELIEAPRSEFVYVAILQRKGLDRKYRTEALDGLAKLRNTDRLTELLGAFIELDKPGAESEPVLAELSGFLLGAKSSELAAKREFLQKMAIESELALSRQVGFAALVITDGSIERAWKLAESKTDRLSNLLLAVSLIPETKIRSAFYSKVEPLVRQSSPPELRRAAIAAIASIPGQESDVFTLLAGLAREGTERQAAIAGLHRIPKKQWPQEQAGPLAENLIEYLQSVPAADRTKPQFSAASQFASELASLLPPDLASALNKSLRRLGVQVIVLRTVFEKMVFDKQLIVVEAGKPVEIILENDDVMQHNLVVTLPGALEEIGMAAEKMPAEPDPDGRLYVPDSPKILFATKLLNPGERTSLSFSAPDQPGDYNYVCTYPAHWRLMNGVLAVVQDVDAYLASRSTSTIPMTEWKLGDLAPDLTKIAGDRNLAGGKQLFTALACAQCHKFGSEGYAFGPDLTDAFKRWQGDRAKVLQQILEPSEMIEDRYRNYSFETKDGESVSGMIVKETADTITIHSGPSDALIQNLQKSSIHQRQPQKSSLMPAGLLNSLSKEQILDLLAYLESAAVHPAGHVH